MSELPADELVGLMEVWRRDPLAWVLAAYPWGEEGGPLANHPGPDNWQLEVLEYIRDNLGKGRPLRIAIAGGVGPGKSALMAWIINWGMATCIDTRCRLTANTGSQISTALWPEVQKWHRMSLFAHWFEAGERRLRSVDPAHKDSWRCDAITWDPHNPEAFAGFHNAGSRIIYGFDESAGIAESIFRESEGILSGAEDTEIIWLCLGNPTRTDTTFRTFFAGGKNAHLWKSWHIDTRAARMSDKAQIQEWIDSYGLDSDFVRVRVLSQFPRSGNMQFISLDVVDAAVRREIEASKYDPVVMGVDVARFGSDASVIYIRRGRDAKGIKSIKLRGADTMTVAARVADEARKYQCDQIFVDGGGVGGGVIDRLRQLHFHNVVEVQFGGKPVRNQIGQDASMAVCYNRRSEIWSYMKEWLEGGAIPSDPELIADLTNIQYGYRLLEGRDAIILERKEDLRARGLESPDVGDALALTFALPIEKSKHTLSFGAGDDQFTADYDPLAIDTPMSQPALPRSF